MAVIEELSSEEDELELEDNPGERAAAAGNEEELLLEENEAQCSDEWSDGSEEWEIPILGSDDEEEPLPNHEVLEVRLSKRGNERLGLVLDDANVVVALREGTPAAASGQILTGDVVIAVQGFATSKEQRVGTLLRELPDAATYAFTLRRKRDGPAEVPDLERVWGAAAAVSEPVAAHGPLMTPEEHEAHQQKELEQRQLLRERIASLPEADETRMALEEQLQPRNLTETKYMASKVEPSPAAKQQMQGMWFRQVRAALCAS